MNKEQWYKIFRDYIKSYESIMHLTDRGILSEDDVPGILQNLIEDIICTFRSEVEE